MKIPVYNSAGKKISETEVPADLFAVAMKPEIVKQVLMAISANQRQPLAHTKGRSEVRGGGRKPWRQKGTGRARHGSIRSPLWIGGGVTFGPTKDRNWQQKVNKKVRRLALKMMLSEKARQEKILVLDELKLPEAKTKELVKVLNNFPLQRNSVLILSPAKDEDLRRAAHNLPKVEIELPGNINTDRLARHEFVLTTTAGLQSVIETFK